MGEASQVSLNDEVYGIKLSLSRKWPGSSVVNIDSSGSPAPGAIV